MSAIPMTFDATFRLGKPARAGKPGTAEVVFAKRRIRKAKFNGDGPGKHIVEPRTAVNRRAKAAAVADAAAWIERVKARRATRGSVQR